MALTAFEPDVLQPQASFRQPMALDVLTPERADYLAATRPTPLGQYLGQEFISGFDSSRIGRAIEEVFTPGARPLPSGRIPRASVATPDQSQVITKKDWEASPDYREGIPWQEGMTGPLAQSLAQSHDARRWREELVSQYQGGIAGRALGFVAQLAGSAVDPTNYIPILGPGARAWALARYGAVAGHALVGGAEGLLNTAAGEPFVVGSLRSRGEDIGVADVALDLALSGIAGGLFGAGAGVLERRALARMTDRQRVASALDQLNAASHAVRDGAPVDVGSIHPAAPEEPAMRVYHGTPHEFSEFDAGKIGTGEGAQAYGHGLYFAENETVARIYREKLGPGAVTDALGDVLREHAGRRLSSEEASAILRADPILARTATDEKAVRALRELLPGYKTEGAVTSTDLANYRTLEDVAQSHPGHLLAVDIRAKPEDFLDWDKPLSEQSAKVKEAIKPWVDELKGYGRSQEKIDALSGAEIYHHIAGNHIAAGGNRGTANPVASQLLLDRGVTGLRYFDSESRHGAEGTHNIVLFDPARARIAERNGVAVAQPDPPHASVTEAERRLPTMAKPRDELDRLAEDLGLGKDLQNIPERQDVAAIERDVGLKPGEKESLTRADETAKVAEDYATAYETLVSCVARAA